MHTAPLAGPKLVVDQIAAFRGEVKSPVAAGTGIEWVATATGEFGVTTVGTDVRSVRVK